ncbi:MAG TPA: hypothetical protein VL572_11630 [Pyrinomonadaceae bacterium]|nr:hypothetical protein [Pyrinomonadaceae bacterium]
MKNVRIGISADLKYELAFYLACFVFLYLHLFIFPTTPIYYESDHVNLLNDAKRLTEGEFIYRDFFEFVFPGSHSLFALLIAIFGAKYWIVNLVIIAHGMVAAFLGVQISRRIIADNAAAYLPSALFVFLGLRWFGLDGEHRMISPLFCYLAVFALLRERTLVRIAFAAAACAFASFFSQQRGVLTAGAIGIFLFVEFGARMGDWRRFFLSSFVLGATYLGVLALLVLPFIVVAGPEVFFTDTILFLRTYAADPQTNSLQTYVLSLTKAGSQGTIYLIVSLFYSILIPGIYFVAIAVAVIKSRRNGWTSQLAGILLVCSVGLFLTFGTSGPNSMRLFQVALPALIAFVWLASVSKILVANVSKAAVAILVIIGILLGIRLQTAWQPIVLETPSGRLAFLSPVISERYEWLLQNAAAGDLVYETYNSHVNFPLGLRNPSRISILLNSGYSTPEHVRWAIEDLKRTNPRYIIWDGTWTREITQNAEGETLEPFYRFMETNYRLVRKFTPYDGREREIWERSDLVDQD